jgi:hypothetical protein
MQVSLKCWKQIREIVSLEPNIPIRVARQFLETLAKGFMKANVGALHPDILA